VITAGIDMGARTLKVLVLRDGEVVACCQVAAAFEARRAAREALHRALAEAGLGEKDLQRTVATGIGREEVECDARLSEVSCIARGAQHLVPAARTVIDVGAEGGMALRCDGRGRVLDFAVNEKCAAGAGAFCETIARVLEVPLDELGPLSLQSERVLALNLQCVVFAESEVVSLIHDNVPKPDIARGVHLALAGRVAVMARRVGLEPELVLVGGLAHDIGFVEALRQMLGAPLQVVEKPVFCAALGAALAAASPAQQRPAPAASRSDATSEPPSRPAPPASADGASCFWCWTEQRGDGAVDWHQAVRVTAGIDIGSVSSQAVVLVDGALFAWASMRTGASSPESARRVLARALEGTDLPVERIDVVVGTGYGRVNVPLAHKTITEIQCHARGARAMFGEKVRTILDMGGQDCKAIRCDATGRVVSFQMNDKCAAGTGRGMEVIADLLQVPIEEIGPLSLATDEEPEPVSSTCVVFAKSEAMTLMRRGWPRERVLAAYCAAMARRVVSLLERVGVARELVITGGIAKNVGVVRRVERLLGVTALPSQLDSQLAGALGAALLAMDL
jgi:benzoyl-CoA reductase subunit A